MTHNTELPKVLVIGTSHSLTIKSGLDALKIPAAHIWANGLVWDMHNIQTGGIYGIRAIGRPRVGVLIRRFFQTMDITHLRDLRIPVIGVMGFAVGTIAPRLHASKNIIYGVEPPPGVDLDDMTLLSRDFTNTYLHSRRWSTLNLVKEIAAVTDLTLVTDPYTADMRNPSNVNHDRIEDILSDWYEAAGAKVFRASKHMVDRHTGHVNPALIDRAHGTVSYGLLTVQKMISQGYLTLPA